jgi:hypothetical protein
VWNADTIAYQAACRGKFAKMVDSRRAEGLKRQRQSIVRHCKFGDECPLYPQKRILEFGREMSALCQKETLCGAANGNWTRAMVGVHF